MKVSEALASRITTRAFLKKPVPEKTVRAILEQATRAPSGGNLQPWNAHVLTGEPLANLIAAVAETRQTHPAGEGSDYDIYPPNLKEPYRARRYRCGEMLYGILGIPREDKTARLAQFAKNYDLFGAPVGLFFTIDREMRQGQWADLGMFMQSLMLLAREYRLHTCPQEAWAVFTPTLRRVLDIPDGHMFFCGMGLGYMDETDKVNELRTERAPLEEVARFNGF